MMIEHNLVHATLAAMLRSNDTFADLFAERTSIAVCEVAEGELHDVQLRTQQGVSLRRSNTSRTQHVHAPDLSEMGLHRLVQALCTGVLPEPSRFSSTLSQGDDLSIEEL